MVENKRRIIINKYALGLDSDSGTFCIVGPEKYSAVIDIKS